MLNMHCVLMYAATGAFQNISSGFGRRVKWTMRDGLWAKTLFIEDTI